MILWFMRKKQTYNTQFPPELINKWTVEKSLDEQLNIDNKERLIYDLQNKLLNYMLFIHLYKNRENSQRGNRCETCKPGYLKDPL